LEWNGFVTVCFRLQAAAFSLSDMQGCNHKLWVSGSKVCGSAPAGGELFEHISKRATFTEATAATICRSLLQYLAHAHGLGVAHMDIKPENIMFDSHGADGVLKVGWLGGGGGARHCLTAGESRVWQIKQVTQL
jgi:hypothetical protein